MIDLRSDTVTKPTQAMREAMASAVVGDDVFGEDPTINRLQEMVADLFGKEAGLFVPSGTMSNQIAIKVHTQPGDEIICETGSHIFRYEGGGPAFLSHVQVKLLDGHLGVITAEQIEPVIRPDNIHNPPTRLISLENTHNSAGGTLFPLDEIKKIHDLARVRGLALHLDGARIWNAHVATGIAFRDYAQYFDTISVCFSKGLGAPVGSMLLGSKALIGQALRYRKIFGGGMRQAGILAAGALYAVEHHIDRLAEDHAKAKRLAQALSEFEAITVDMDTVQTNMLYFQIDPKKMSAASLVARCQSQRLLFMAVSPSRVRCVMHLDISPEQIEEAITIFQKVLSES